MKKLMCALAVLMLTCSQAQALFMGTLQREDWTLEIASSSPDGTTAVTVYYLGNGLQVIEIMSVPAGDTVQQVVAKPGKNVRRIIIEVDPPNNGVLFGATARIVQGADQFIDIISELRDARLVFDVE
jgi:hypothetical protein